MLKENPLKSKLAAGKPVMGTWCVVPSSVTAEILAQGGFDFLILDGEHGPLSYETMQTMAMACEANGISPLVRVPGALEADILKALDIGAHGVHVPNVNDLETLRRAIALAKYPPRGRRGLSPFTRAGGYGPAQVKILPDQANRNTLLTVHLEGREAVEEVDSLLEEEDLDILFIGLFDLSKALGIPGQIEDPHLLEIARQVIKKTNQKGKVAGTIVTNRDQLNRMLDWGVRYFTYSVDCHLFLQAAEDVVRQFRAASAVKP